MCVYVCECVSGVCVCLCMRVKKTEEVIISKALCLRRACAQLCRVEG